MYIDVDDDVRSMYIRSVMHLSDFMAGKNPNGKVLKDEDVAAAIGRSRVTVSRIRRRKVRPDWETISAIEKFTGGLVTANDFAFLPPHQQEKVA